jgi:hypothetical protein
MTVAQQKPLLLNLIKSRSNRDIIVLDLRLKRGYFKILKVIIHKYL